MYFARIGAALHWHRNPNSSNDLCPKPGFVNIIAVLGSQFQCCTQFAPKAATATAPGRARIRDRACEHREQGEVTAGDRGPNSDLTSVMTFATIALHTRLDAKMEDHEDFSEEARSHRR